MNYSILQAILSFLLGHKYYANITLRRGTDDYGLACFIFHNRQEADIHRGTLRNNRSYEYIETVSFRSRQSYPTVKR